jgi:hypothetical protein
VEGNASNLLKVWSKRLPEDRIEASEVRALNSHEDAVYVEYL